MSTTKSLKAGYATTGWEEKTVSAEGAAIKITHVRTERKFSGAMQGTGVAEYVIVYHPDSKSPSGPHAGKPTSSYVGTCHFKGTIDGSEEGEVVFLTGNGSFVETAKADWTIDEKTAVGGLKGLKGKGGYEHGVDAKWDEETSVWLECSL